MKYKILGYIFLGLVFAAAVGAVYWWQKPRVNKQATVNSNQTDPTADWKTYTSSQHGFELKIPASWKVKFQSGIHLYFTFISPDDIAAEQENLKNCYAKPPSPSCAIEGGNYQSILLLITPKNLQRSLPTKVYSQRTINNLTFDEYDTVDGHFYGIVHSDFVYELDFNTKLKDQILSTFKFISSTQSDTANWKTYTNSKYGFEFKYPSEWQYQESEINGIMSINFIFTGCSMAQCQEGSQFYVEIEKTAMDGDIQNYWDRSNRQSVIFGNTTFAKRTFQSGGISYLIKNGPYTIIFPSTTDYIQILSTFKFINQSNQTGSGTLSGQVSIGPICPVERADMPCTPSPETYAAHEFLVLSVQKEVARFHADANGKYSLSLPAGTYTVTTAKTGFGYASKGLPQTIAIKSNETTNLNISIDTGIR